MARGRGMGDPDDTEMSSHGLKASVYYCQDTVPVFSFLGAELS